MRPAITPLLLLHPPSNSSAYVRPASAACGLLLLRLWSFPIWHSSCAAHSRGRHSSSRAASTHTAGAQQRYIPYCACCALPLLPTKQQAKIAILPIFSKFKLGLAFPAILSSMYFDFDADTHMTDDPEEVSGFGAINPSNNPNIDEYSRFPSRQQMKNVLTFAKLLEIIDHYCELQDRLVDDEIAEDFQLSNLRMIVNEFIETFDEISHYDDDIYEWEITHHIVECMFSLGHECGSWPIGDKLFNYAFSNRAVLIVLYLIEVGAPINVDRTIYLKEFIDAPLFRHLCDVTEININSECLEGSHCIDQQVEALFKTFMNLKLPVGITVEQVAASCSPKIKYLLRDIPINTFGIASFFEKDWKSFCYELEPSYSLMDI